MQLKENHKDNLVKYFKSVFNYAHATLTPFKELMHEIDIAYARESANHKKTKTGTTNAELKKKNLLENIELPTLKSLTESAQSYLDGVYLTGFPIFGVVSSPKNIAQARMMEAKFENDMLQFGWVSNFHKAFKDSLKYNLCCVLPEWHRQKGYELDPTSSLARNDRKRKDIIYAGNKIKYINLYNAFWDPRVLPNEIHTKGEFAGYTERLGRIAFKQLLNELGDEVIQSSIEPALQSMLTDGSTTLMYDSMIRTTTKDISAEFNWATWLDPSAIPQKKIEHKNTYVVTTMFCRIIPEDFGLQNLKGVIAPRSPQIWKFIVVNANIILYAEHLTNAHDFLPMIFSQADDDGLGYETKGFCETLIGFQSLGSSLQNARIASLRRSIGDRALYNARMINPADMNSSNPAHKIPVNNLLPNQKLSDAYFRIPFEDNQAAQLSQEVAQTMQFAQNSVGVNQAQQGNFVKGNKTREEFSTIMDNAAARQQSFAICIEDTMMRPVKTILKLNLFQYGTNETLFSKGTKEELTLDISSMINAGLEYKISDGLLPSSKIASIDQATMALTFIQSTPQIQQFYDMQGLFSYIMKQQGFTDIADFELTPEAMRQKQQEAIAVNAANTAAQSAAENAGASQNPPAQ